MPDNAPFGIYVHWPWCQAICPYCDFNRYPAASVNQDEWVVAYCRALTTYHNHIGPRTVGSVYFGGGTPSLMHPGSVADILETISGLWDVDARAEITLEANPTSSESENFSGYAAAGVNRLSLGIQSLRDSDLALLGRQHTAHEALDAYALAQRHSNNVNIDLIFGRQHQTLEDWCRELDEALQLGSQHLSLYQLTIEPETGFGQLHRKDQLPGLPDEDRAADMQMATYQLCQNAGYHAYEVSSFAGNGHAGRHNLLYWRYDDFLGIGPGAHSRLTLQDQRYAIDTFRKPREFLNALTADGTGEVNRRPLSAEEQAEEYLMNALRLDEGASLKRFLTLGGITPAPAAINDLAHAGWLVADGDRIRTTLQGRMRLNPILLELLQGRGQDGAEGTIKS